MIVVQKFLDVPMQASLVERDHMIQAFAANGADRPFHISALPRRLGADRICLMPIAFTRSTNSRQRSDLDRATSNAVRSPKERLPASVVPSTPQWMSGDVEVHNSSALMRLHQKHVRDLEPDGRYDEEVDRHDRFTVILEEGSPG